MWPPPGNHVDGVQPMQKLVAVAIDKDKGSQVALKWAVDNLLTRGQIVVLVHVRVKQSATGSSAHGLRINQVPVEEIENDPQVKEIFLPFRVFCSRKDIQSHEVVLDDADVARAITDFVEQSSIDIMVLGAASKNSFFRFKAKDIPGTVLKGAPDYCTVYVINKGKISSTRAACRPGPSIISPLRSKIMSLASCRYNNGWEPGMPSSTSSKSSFSVNSRPGSEFGPITPRTRQSDVGTIKSPFTHRRAPNGRSYEMSEPETDISFVSSERRSDVYSAYSESFDGGLTPPRFSGYSEIEYQSMDSWYPARKSVDIGRKSVDVARKSIDIGRQSVDIGRKSVDFVSQLELPISSDGDMSLSGQSMDDVEAEMRRLKQELKQTMDMYSTACKEALSAREKTRELQKWKMEEERRLEEARLAEESAQALAEKQKERSNVEAAQRLAELEAQKRINTEMNSLQGNQDNAMLGSVFRYRKYTIEEIEIATDHFAPSRKIGEGGYGPVYKCYLDHTPAAVKVLRPDAAHGRAQFHQEVEILCCIRHPNMVLLLGACPEYGCLVYEYMSNGSLEDCLFQHGKNPPLSWRHRFRIAAEIATGLHFLHQTKPEPLVHRDLKPGNILLDRNYVSKISDVGLARLVPPSVSDSVTQYRLTSTAGTFCYIDPEYQQTGMLGVKSDIYSLGIIYLQILTALPPMGITHRVENAIEQGTFADLLDRSVPDWPVEEALDLANLALKCAELRRKDRPDLGKVVLPFLNRLRDLSDDDMYEPIHCGTRTSPSQTDVFVTVCDNLSFAALSTRSSIEG